MGNGGYGSYSASNTYDDRNRSSYSGSSSAYGPPLAPVFSLSHVHPSVVPLAIASSSYTLDSPPFQCATMFLNRSQTNISSLCVSSSISTCFFSTQSLSLAHTSSLGALPKREAPPILSQKTQLIESERETRQAHEHKNTHHSDTTSGRAATTAHAPVSAILMTERKHTHQRTGTEFEPPGRGIPLIHTRTDTSPAPIATMQPTHMHTMITQRGLNANMPRETQTTHTHIDTNQPLTTRPTTFYLPLTHTTNRLPRIPTLDVDADTKQAQTSQAPASSSPTPPVLASSTTSTSSSTATSIRTTTWRRAEPRCRAATMSLTSLLAKHAYSKKLYFSFLFSCPFCSKKGHMASFCPSRPNERPLADARSEKWITALLSKTAQRMPDTSCETENPNLPELMAFVEKEGARLNTDNPWLTSKETRDRLRQNAGFWKAIGTNNVVLSWILRGVPAHFVTEPDHLAFPNHPSYYEHIDFVDQEIKQHLQDGSFVEIDYECIKVVNPIQVEPKHGGKGRMCIDARFPNAYLAGPQFHLETLERDLPDIIQRGDVMITTDLRKAYYAVPLDEQAAPYFTFRHKNKYYAPRVIIFGECLAPFLFHKIMRETVKALRTARIRTLNYLDDNIWCMRKRFAAEITRFAKWFYPRLGFDYNEKCVWTPAHIVDFLGLLVDALKFMFAIPKEKLADITRNLQSITQAVQNENKISLTQLQSLLGKLNAARAALEPAGTWTRALHEVAAHPSAQDVCTIQIGSRAHEELTFWCNQIQERNGYRIRDTGTQIDLHTDASEMGYGGHALGIKVFGQLTAADTSKSSTWRELFGLNAAARQLTRILHHKHVRVMLDSQCAIAILSKGGSNTHQPGLSDLAKDWWKWCDEQQITPTYTWCPRTENKAADELSKVFDQSWDITDTTFNRITQKWGRMSKLTGEEVNTLIESPPQEEEKKERILLIPRFTAITSTLRIAQALHIKACLIYPGWHAQTWWPTIQHLAIDTVTLPSSRYCLTCPQTRFLPDWPMLASKIDF